ncbi:dTDP-glucose 4,6-dehydratase [Salinispora pacifica]|uniref:dTDP-glucose 4,6-dehydratase n=1 Tax=Salinispora pacifica TaxID=351187 RepID=UPI00035E23E0|nr:dTDP-glucose 4,6-dehydratase [Salinispora pacifica]
MRILVTGGAGFIGSCLVRMALRGELPGLEDARITVLDALTYSGNRANLDPVLGHARLTLVHGDICDADLVDALLPGHDAVVHLAAETHVDRSIDGGTAFVRTNVLGTSVLLEAALRHGVARFVHVSTDEVYGSIEVGAWDEDCSVRPNSPYSASKAGADVLAMAYHHTHELPVIITRGSNTYGPYQFPEKIIPLFVTNLLDGLTVPVYGDGENVRDWLHVTDHCRGIALALTGGRPGRVYHVGGGTEITNNELAALLIQACGANSDLIQHVTDRRGHDRRYALDISRITAELGYRPRVPFRNGIRTTVEWYRAHRAWWQPLRRRMEQEALMTGR